MRNPVFKSAFAEDFMLYKELLESEGKSEKTVSTVAYYLSSLDSHLLAHAVEGRAIPVGLLEEWISASGWSRSTVCTMLGLISRLRGFMISRGCQMELPERPRFAKTYSPYLFSEEETARIAGIADMFGGSSRHAASDAQFPILFRVLLGCGLRLGEALALEWNSVDLANGILTIRRAKGNKERLVPMSGTLGSVIAAYKRHTESKGICKRFLFESEAGKHYSQTAFWHWFRNVIEKAGLPKKTGSRRGVCAHCLRHTFAARSSQHLTKQGRTFGDIVSIMAKYLGHESFRELECYLNSDYQNYRDSQDRAADFTNDLLPKVDF
jgi:integrase